MGGNVSIDVGGEMAGAEQLDFEKLIDRSAFRQDFLEMFHALDEAHKKQFDQSVWPQKTRDSLLTSAEVFSGSSRHLFGTEIHDDEFVAHKPTVGDIDVSVPEEKLLTLKAVLDEFRGKFITDSVKCIGSQKGNQVNALFEYTLPVGPGKGTTVNVQVDFVGVDFDNDLPNEFAQFAHSSEWADIKAGVKGVFHKYLLRSIAGISSRIKDGILLTSASTPEKYRISKDQSPMSNIKFSVDKGVRQPAYEPVLTKSGDQFVVNGRPAYKEVPVKSSTYDTSLKGIFKSMFGSDAAKGELAKFRSFEGLLQLMKEMFTDEQIENIYEDFINYKLFESSEKGNVGQELYAKDPDKDRNYKLAAVDKFRSEFPFLQTAEKDAEVQSLVDTYYKRYGMRRREPEDA